MHHRTNPIADWGLRPALHTVVVPRHRRTDAAHRGRYYAYRWPEHSQRDLLERSGRWSVFWSAVGLFGLTTLVVALFEGSDSRLVGWANLTLVVAMCGVHAWNAVRSRRRRSVLLAPVLSVVAAAGALECVGAIAIAWDDLLFAVFVCWAPITAADITAPASTYLVPVDRPK